MIKYPFYTSIFTLILIAGLQAQVELGIDVLEKNGFLCLKDKRVGLLTHPAGVNSKGRSTIDILSHSQNVNLVALYGPEHGIYGNEHANVAVPHHIDSKTGLKVYSLYGTHRRPSSEMLRGIDVMVIDLQDIGVRSYTYVSCMCYTMEECFKQGIEVIVLDRPNPLGGLKTDGPTMEKKWSSYVGLLPIPYVHGLTIGELAYICKQEPNWLTIPNDIRKKGKLTIIPMQGWNRSMLWPQTELQWVPTSPNIQDFNAVLGYPMTGLGCQIGDFLHGLGTQYPFRLITHPNKKISDLEKILQSKNISGIAFEKRASFNQLKAQHGEGLYITITNFTAWHPTELSFHLMQLSCQLHKQNPFANETHQNISLFNKHVGSSDWYHAIKSSGARVNLDFFLKKWRRESQNFQTWSKQYWLY